MNQPGQTLADEIIRVVQINRTTLNGLDHGEIIFRVHQGHLVEVTTSETLRLSTRSQLSPINLKVKEDP